MATKDFCPIMTIGFAPPEKGKRDNRLCNRDCAWYNLSEEECIIRTIADHLETIKTLADDIAYNTGNTPYDNITNPFEEEEYDRY